jgi:hypothetical protein
MSHSEGVLNDPSILICSAEQRFQPTQKSRSKNQRLMSIVVSHLFVLSFLMKSFCLSCDRENQCC